MWLIYRLFTFALDLGLGIRGLFHQETAIWNQKRSKDLLRLEDIRRSSGDKKLIWIHCASVGEYQQAKPIIRSLKSSFEDLFILVSFFSPSGYNQFDQDPIVDEMIYLPIDRLSRVSTAVDDLSPTLFIGVKYEFWWQLLKILHLRNVPIIYTSVLINDPYFLKPLFKAFLPQLKKMKAIFTQDEESVDTLTALGFQNVIKSGDSRVDQVITRRAHLVPSKILPTSHKKTIIYGSIYLSDLEVIAEVIMQDDTFRHVIVPHHVDSDNISRIQSQLGRRVPTIDNALPSHDVIIVDKLGVLFNLYQEAYAAYVGGGFGHNIHNVLEPMAFHIPVAFGPKFSGFKESEYLVEQLPSLLINDKSDFKKYLAKTLDTEYYLSAKVKMINFLERNRDASTIVINHLKKMNLI